MSRKLQIIKTAKYAVQLLALFGFILAVVPYLPHPSETDSHFLQHLGGTTYLMSEFTYRSFLRKEVEDMNMQLFTPNPKYKNYCINNKDPATLNDKQKLHEFTIGPCVPMVLSPGLLGSKLEVHIDCIALRTFHPDIFDTCGWKQCGAKGVLGHAPQKVYKLWISELNSEVSVMNPSKSTCWGKLIGQAYDFSESDLKRKYKSPLGVKVVPRHHRDELQQCGFGSQNNLLAIPIEPESTKAYEPMMKNLEYMGYQVGLTLYGAPYDWRVTTLANGVHKALEDSARQAYALTGKPSVLVAHSMGNHGVVKLLTDMSQQDKNRFIHAFVSITNALAGSPKSMLAWIGGNTEFFFLDKFGMSAKAQKLLFNANSAGIDLLPQDPYTEFKGEKWLEEWVKRIHMEEDKTTWTEAHVNAPDFPFKWFPHTLQNCFKGFSHRAENCGLYQYDWSKDAVIDIPAGKFTVKLEDKLKMFKDHVNIIDGKNGQAMLRDTRKSFVYKLKNPGVPVILIWASHVPTKRTFKWNTDPKIKIANDEYAYPDSTTEAAGDGTVPSATALMPAFKWGYEFDNKVALKLQNAKPVKAVEICSHHNMKATIYDKVGTGSNPHKFDKNEYVGIGCDCNPADGATTDGIKCDHVTAMSDSKVVELVADVGRANRRNRKPEKTQGYILSDTQLKLLAKRCPLVGIGLENFLDVFREAQENQRKIQQPTAK